MILILQIAIGIVLGWLGVLGIGAAIKRRRMAFVRRVTAPGAGLDHIPQPSTRAYTEYAPGVQYGRDGVAINSVDPNAPRPLSLLGWVMALYFWGIVVAAVLIGLGAIAGLIR
jgi:hypothetical protein